MNVNITYDDMMLPTQGPENPYGDRNRFFNQNVLAGHVDVRLRVLPTVSDSLGLETPRHFQKISFPSYLKDVICNLVEIIPFILQRLIRTSENGQNGVEAEAYRDCVAANDIRLRLGLCHGTPVVFRIRIPCV